VREPRPRDAPSSRLSELRARDRERAQLVERGGRESSVRRPRRSRTSRPLERYPCERGRSLVGEDPSSTAADERLASSWRGSRRSAGAQEPSAIAATSATPSPPLTPWLRAESRRTASASRSTRPVAPRASCQTRFSSTWNICPATNLRGDQSIALPAASKRPAFAKAHAQLHGSSRRARTTSCVARRASPRQLVGLAATPEQSLRRAAQPLELEGRFSWRPP